MKSSKQANRQTGKQASSKHLSLAGGRILIEKSSAKWLKPRNDKVKRLTMTSNEELSRLRSTLVGFSRLLCDAEVMRRGLQSHPRQPKPKNVKKKPSTGTATVRTPSVVKHKGTVGGWVVNGDFVPVDKTVDHQGENYPSDRKLTKDEANRFFQRHAAFQHQRTWRKGRRK